MKLKVNSNNLNVHYVIPNPYSSCTV